MEDLPPQAVAVLRVLLRKFRSLGELWDARHEHYGDAARVEAGYASLLKIMLIIEPNANIIAVFNKICCFITAFAKEYSDGRRRTRGNCVWYMEELQFLADAMLVCNDDSSTVNLSWLQKPSGLGSTLFANLAMVCSIIVTEPNPDTMVDIKLEEDPPSIDAFLSADPLMDNVAVSSSNDSQDSFQSAVTIGAPTNTIIPIDRLQSDPLADAPKNPLPENHSNARAMVSRTSPPPLVTRSIPALPINVPPLAFFKPIQTAQASAHPQPEPIAKPTESVQQTKRNTIFAMHIASKLQGLGLQQRGVVKDMINEVITQAELGLLKLDHVSDVQEALHEAMPVVPT